MAPFRRPILPRSGHLIADSVPASTELTFVKGSSGFYRIYNTGLHEFTVKATNESAVAVQSRCSVDVKVVAGDIGVQPTANAVKGIYEYVDPRVVIRNGKFKRSGTPAFTIVQQGGKERYYRILNSGKKNAFKVLVNGTEVTTLRPRLSIDVVADASIMITRAGTAMATGIYDFLDPRNEIQPGRFNVKLSNDGAGNVDKHPIINLTGGTSAAIYRIHNTGPNRMVVKIHDTVITDSLLEDQAIDFDVDGDEKDITVSPHDVGENIDIQGLYEFLGP